MTPKESHPPGATHTRVTPETEADDDPRTAAEVTPELQKQALVRLRRIEGQIRGLHRMVEEERYCADVLTQISSVHEALRSVGKLLMRNHLEHCVTDALRSGDRLEAEEAYQEVLELMYKHAR